MNFKRLLILKRFERLGLHLPKISDGAMKHYRNDIKGNRMEESFMSEVKILRNWNLGKQYFSNNDVIKKGYGNLSMTLDKKTNTITTIKNRHGRIYDRYGKSINTYRDIDLKLKEQLNNIIGA